MQQSSRFAWPSVTFRPLSGIHPSQLVPLSPCLMLMCQKNSTRWYLLIVLSYTVFALMLCRIVIKGLTGFLEIPYMQICKSYANGLQFYNVFFFMNIWIQPGVSTYSGLFGLSGVMLDLLTLLSRRLEEPMGGIQTQVGLWPVETLCWEVLRRCWTG